MIPELVWFTLLVLAWTGALRWVPWLLRTAIEKNIDSTQSQKLAELTAALEARYSTLKTSVDYLSVQQGAMRPRTISSVEALWKHILTLEEEFGHLLMFDTTISRQTIREIYAQDRIHGFLGPLRRCQPYYREARSLPTLAHGRCQVVCRRTSLAAILHYRWCVWPSRNAHTRISAGG